MREEFAECISSMSETAGGAIYLHENTLFYSTFLAPLTYNFNVLMASDYYLVSEFT